jgi:hypothetical protein
MATPDQWLSLLSTVKAVFDSVTAGLDLTTAYEKHRTERDTIAESRRVSVAYSTYSPEAITSIEKRFRECEARFILEGSGEGRVRCFCSVFKDVIDGNGGVLPLIDDWERIYEQLHCETGGHYSKKKRSSAAIA